MPMTRLRATRGSTTVSPPTAEAVASEAPGPEEGRAESPRLRLRSEVRRAAAWAAS
ncbi:hypothetical protein SANTM175S_04570 [Streptomyces antimycoticus]